MQINSRHVQKVLHSIGLSEYEAKVYESLVLNGPSESRYLSMISGVPRTKIYHTLKKLIERHLVLELPTNPQQFVSKSPSNAFKQYLTRLTQKTSEEVITLVNSKDVFSLLEEVYNKQQKTTIHQNLWVIHGQHEILSKMRDLLSQTKIKITVITTEYGFLFFYRAFNKMLDKLQNVDIHIKTPINTHNDSFIHELQYIYEIKHLAFDLPLLCLFIDNTTSLIVNLNSNKTSEIFQNNLALFSDSPALYDLFSLLFAL